MYFGQNRIAEKLSIHSELQGRFYNLDNFNQLLARVGLNYHINKEAMLTAGYAYIPTESFEKGSNLKSSIEHRIWEQFILKNNVGRVFFEHRYRLEQRWIENNSNNSKYLNRARYRLMLTIPLNHETKEDKTVYLGIYDEIFLNLTSQPFDQNRLYFALGYKFNKTVDIQAGYLKHHYSGLGYDRLQFALFFNPDLRKKE